MYMEEVPSGAKRKVKQVVVRKPPRNSSERSLEDDYQIPLAAQDSLWSGISFNLPDTKTEDTDNETEIRVFNLDEEEKVPLLLLFPGIKDELRNNMSSTSVTRLLVGKEANVHLLKASKKLPKRAVNLSPVTEDSESSVSVASLHFRAMQVQNMSSQHDIEIFNSDIQQEYWGDVSSEENDESCHGNESLLERSIAEEEENNETENEMEVEQNKEKLQVQQ